MDESLAKIRHNRSKKDFPDLPLGDDEFVEFAFNRAKVCLSLILGATVASLAIIFIVFLFVIFAGSAIDAMGKNFMFIILAALLAATIIMSLVSIMVYHGNQLFITNKRVIQKTMESPVAHSVNIIDLASVEDASFHQNGILPALFHYGTLRLATVGDETSYTFKYSDISNKDLQAITKLISSAKKSHKTKEKSPAESED